MASRLRVMTEGIRESSKDSTRSPETSAKPSRALAPIINNLFHSVRGTLPVLVRGLLFLVQQSSVGSVPGLVFQPVVGV